MTKIRKCNRGSHKSIDRVLKPVTLADGYNYVIVSDESGKPSMKRVDELVAAAFIDGYTPRMEIVHADGDNANDNLDNLRIVIR